MGKFMLLLMSMVLLCVMFLAGKALFQEAHKNTSTKDFGANTAQATGVVGQLPAINNTGATFESATETAGQTAYEALQAAILPPASINSASLPEPSANTVHASPVLEETRRAGPLAFLKEPNFIAVQKTELEAWAGAVPFHPLL